MRQGTMQLSYSELMQVLAKLHWISDEGLGAFKARMRKLQGEGVPAGANPGKGKRVDYSLKMTFEAAIALELLQCGMSPAEAARIIEANRHEFYLAMLLGTVGNKLHGEENDPVLLINPEALRQYSVRADDDDPLLGKVAFMRRRTMAKLFSKRKPFEPETGESWRWAIVDLGTVSYSLLAVIQIELGIADELIVELLEHEYSDHRAGLDEFREKRLNVVFTTAEDAAPGIPRTFRSHQEGADG